MIVIAVMTQLNNGHEATMDTSWNVALYIYFCSRACFSIDSYALWW